MKPLIVWLYRRNSAVRIGQFPPAELTLSLRASTGVVEWMPIILCFCVNVNWKWDYANDNMSWWWIGKVDTEKKNKIESMLSRGETTGHHLSIPNAEALREFKTELVMILWKHTSAEEVKCKLKLRIISLESVTNRLELMENVGFPPPFWNLFDLILH